MCAAPTTTKPGCRDADAVVFRAACNSELGPSQDRYRLLVLPDRAGFYHWPARPFFHSIIAIASIGAVAADQRSTTSKGWDAAFLRCYAAYIQAG